MRAKSKARKARKPDKREAFNVECMSKIIMYAQAYLDGIDGVAPTAFKIHDLVQRIVNAHIVEGDAK